MSEKKFIAKGDIYDIYQDGDKAVRIYKGEQYKEKCLYAALTHARCETTLVNSFIRMPVIREVSVIDGNWALTMDFIEGKTLQELMGFEDMSVGIAYLAVTDIHVREVFSAGHPRA